MVRIIIGHPDGNCFAIYSLLSYCSMAKIHLLLQFAVVNVTYKLSQTRNFAMPRNILPAHTNFI